MKRTVAILLLLMLIVTAVPVFSEDTLYLEEINGTIRPGNAVEIVFHAPYAGRADILLSRDAEGTEILSVIAWEYAAESGMNSLYWNGTDQGVVAPEGDGYVLLRMQDAQAVMPVHIGPVMPMLLNASAQMRDAVLELTFFASCPGQVTVRLEAENGGVDERVYDCLAGQQTLAVEAGGVQGAGTGRAVLRDDTGTASAAAAFEFLFPEEAPVVQASHVENTESTDVVLDEEVVLGGEEYVEMPAQDGEDMPQEEAAQNVQDSGVFTPSTTSPYAPMEGETNYWTTPMDITDEAAVWAAIIEPITVLDNGKKNAQKMQVVIRSEPDENSEGVGVVTMVSQGVRILEPGEEWTKIECYSSSFHDSKVKAWNMLVQGYVPTSYLKTVVPDQEIGYVVDKLTQRIYIFQNGHLMDELLVSTGHANEKQPYNETRSGAFLLLVPAVGGYEDDGMYVQMAIRYNGGDMMHQVPYTLARDGTKYFGTFEPRLGTKASHGCIRVQRRKTPDGYNIEWIWKHKKNNQKFLIWEDWQGRQIAYPDADETLYYNPKGGKYYHSSETCNSAKGVHFTAFTYGELESEGFAGLTRCTWCNPPLRTAEIDEINALYAPGGDHDPILTEARRKSAESGK